MKATRFIALALVTFVSTASAETSTPAPVRWDFYAQASALVAWPGDFDTATGGAVAVGVAMNQVHSLEVEVSYFESSEGGDDVEFIPILATYHYRMPLTPQLTLKLGASLGATHERSEWYWLGMFNTPGRWYQYSDTAFTYGLSVGASYALTQRLSFDATVKALGLEETDLTTSGGITLLTLGFNFRF